VSGTNRPVSLEGRWDILYRDYADVYDEFARIPKVPDLGDLLNDRFSIAGQTVVDVGAGSGLSTLMVARHAREVVGVEVEPAMLAVARKRAETRDLDNVRFVLGDAEHLPLPDKSVDAAVAITLSNVDRRIAAAEMERVVRPGGTVIWDDVAPGWYGGELEPIITGEPRAVSTPRDDILAELGYGYVDLFMDQDYGTVEHLVNTYGFIHSKRAIDYIREHRLTTIRWKFRIRYKRITE